MIARRKRLPSRPDPACRRAVAAMRRATADLNDAHLEDCWSSRCWVRGANLSPSLVMRLKSADSESLVGLVLGGRRLRLGTVNRIAPGVRLPDFRQTAKGLQDDVSAIPVPRADRVQ